MSSAAEATRTAERGCPAAQILRRVLLREPYSFSPAEMDAVRAAGPLVEVWPGTFAVTGHDASRAVLRHPGFLVEDAAVFGERLPDVVGHASAQSFLRELLSLNGEAHQRLRTVMAQAFVPPASQRMEQIVAASVLAESTPLGARLRQGDPVDADAFCTAVPALAIGRLLGLPDELAGPMADWSDTFSDALRSNFLSRVRVQAADDAVRAMQAALRPFTEPGAVAPDSVLALLVEHHPDLADVLGRDDLGLLANVILLYSAGLDTTRSLLRAVLSEVAGDPGLAGLLAEDPRARTRFLREMERLHPPIELTSRHLPQPVVLDGHALAAGSHVLVLIDAANRDPASEPGADLHRWSLTGRARRSITFGGGVRTCLGLPMARLLTEAVLAHVTTHWPAFLAHDPARPALVLRRALPDQPRLRLTSGRLGGPGLTTVTSEGR